MNTDTETAHTEASPIAVRRVLRAFETTVEELGPGTPLRQVMILLLIAEANRSGIPIGVRDIDHHLGDLKSGSASKLLRSMMHVETERKPGVAHTVTAVRDTNDLRRWDLHLTPKGKDAVSAIARTLEGSRR